MTWGHDDAAVELREDLEPDQDEVLQAEPEYSSAPVPVCVEGPVRTQQLPRKGGSTKTVAVGVVPVRILRADRYRYNAKLMSIGGVMLFSFSQTGAQDPSTMAAWPASTQYVCEAATDLWVCAATGTITLSVVTERWAEGK